MLLLAVHHIPEAYEALLLAYIEEEDMYVISSSFLAMLLPVNPISRTISACFHATVTACTC